MRAMGALSKVALRAAGAVASSLPGVTEGASAFASRPWTHNQQCRAISLNTRICQTNTNRCDYLHDEFANMAFCCFQSTGQKQPFDNVEKHRQQWTQNKVRKHQHYSFGYPPGGHCSTGVGISIHQQLFSLWDVQRVEVPRGEFAELQGRAGLVRCVRGRLDLTLISMYFPVRGHGIHRKAYEDLVRLLVKWLRVQADLTPQRSLLCIGMDRNDKIGFHKAIDDSGRQGFVRSFDESAARHGAVEVVGKYATGREAFVSPLLRSFAEDHRLCFLCSHFKVGPTFYGPGYATEIDDVLVPQGVLKDVSVCRILKGLAMKTSSINVKGLRDHVPIYFQFELQYLVHTPQFVFRFDRDRLMQAILGDHAIRDPFVSEVCRELERRQGEFDSFGFNPDKMWGMMQQIIVEVARKYFKRNDRSTEPPALQVARQLKEKLLQDRRTLALHRGRNNPDLNLTSRLWFFSIDGLVANRSQALIRKKVAPAPGFTLTEMDRDSGLLLSRVNKKIKVLADEVQQHKRYQLLEELSEAVHVGDAAQQWFLTYRLAANRRGPKNRCFKRPPSRRPLSDVWTEYLSKPGPEGGCEGREIDFQEESAQMEEDTMKQPHNEMSKEIAVQVERDIEGIRRYCKIGAKRRTVPSFAAPLECYWMLFMPNARVKVSKSGVGFQREKRSTHVFYMYVRQLLYAVYVRQWAPLIWSHAEAAQLPKATTKTHDCAHVRLIFLFCPFAKGFFAQLLKQTLTDEQKVFSDYVHAFVPRRRRESAVLSACIVPQKMAKISFSSVNDLHDKSNAFLSMAKEPASQSARELVPVLAAQIAALHISLSSFRLQCPDKCITILGSCGILPGAPLVVAVWVAAFQPAIDEFARLEQENEYAHVMQVQAPDGVVCDVSLNVFADDTQKAHAVPEEESFSLVEIVKQSTHNLDVSLKSINISQNLSKRELIPYIVGPQKRACQNHFVFSKPFDARVVFSARYLGCRLSASGNNVIEREFRIKAMNRGYAEMGRFWSDCVVYKHVRSVFVAKVYSASTSGLTSFVWKRSDSNVVEQRLCYLLRRAARNFVLQEFDEQYVSLSNREMLHKFRLATHFDAVRVARLRMYQAWALHPADFRQPIACLFGVWCSSDITDFCPVSFERTKLLHQCSPYVQQFVSDMSDLQYVNGGDKLLARLEGRFPALFCAKTEYLELVQMFCSLDVAELKVRTLSAVISPPSVRSNVLRTGMTDMHVYKFFRLSHAEYTQDTGKSVKTKHVSPLETMSKMITETELVCPVSVDRLRCNRSFATSSALASHMRLVHGGRNIVSSAVVRNVCIFCYTVFRTVRDARQHAVRAYQRGVCRVDQAKFPHIAMKRPTKCPLCFQSAQTDNEFDQHILTHFDKLPDLCFKQVDGVEGIGSEFGSRASTATRQETKVRSGFGFNSCGHGNGAKTGRRRWCKGGWQARKARKEGEASWLSSGAQRASGVSRKAARDAGKSDTPKLRRVERDSGIAQLHLGIRRGDKRSVGGDKSGGSGVSQNDSRGKEGGGGGEEAAGLQKKRSRIRTSVSSGSGQVAGARISENGGVRSGNETCDRPQGFAGKIGEGPRTSGGFVDCWSFPSGECTQQHKKDCNEDGVLSWRGGGNPFLSPACGIQSTSRKATQKWSNARSTGAARRSKAALMIKTGVWEDRNVDSSPLKPVIFVPASTPDVVSFPNVSIQNEDSRGDEDNDDEYFEFE